jgi:hypothetical protein
VAQGVCSAPRRRTILCAGVAPEPDSTNVYDERQPRGRFYVLHVGACVTQTGRSMRAQTDFQPNDRRRKLEARLDEALAQTFPASDPFSVGRFTGTEPPSRPVDRRAPKSVPLDRVARRAPR